MSWYVKIQIFFGIFCLSFYFQNVWPLMKSKKELQLKNQSKKEDQKVTHERSRKRQEEIKNDENDVSDEE